MYLKSIILIMFMVSVCRARDPLPDMTDPEFQQDCLKTTNDYRSRHQAPPVTIDPKIVEYAKSRCQLESQFHRLDNHHRGLDKHLYGENFAWKGNSEDVVGTCKQALEKWYKEGLNYDYDNPGTSHNTGHFSQLVWVGSSQMGCARCYGKGDKYYETYVVCDYHPPGNIRGEYQDNVLPEQ
ncbi:Golgi-associated plant pathogenesis-related protein 1-like [Oppia nitens]|uniref:Golgi-associated plant pathogenesis-related protein 1-like n=1 Tax=Oppia nitens TaxID=1686743 RepID=UPI0023DBB2F1|nr:Golgi-associated plant pathogenesis-related protein 1-like [Oppia nitens]